MANRECGVWLPLRLQEGAAILVTAREEEAWWRGETDGRQGVFPSNYVEPAK